MNNTTPHRYDPLSALAKESDGRAFLLESQPGAETAALPAEPAARESAAAGADKPVSENWIEPAQARLFPESLAQRLVAAREARGWSVADAATKLRLPLHVVKAIEAESFECIGQGIYLRSYLTNYARLVGVPADAVDAVVQRNAAAPPQLIASGRISHSRYLVERYSGSALYVVLTGVIFVPLIMFAMNMGGDTASRLLPLDAPAAASAGGSTPPNATVELPISGNPDATTNSQPAAPSAKGAPNHLVDAPLMATLTPVLRQPASDTGRVQSEQAAAATPPSVKLSLAEASWVEIVDADGKRLEYGILPAGSVRSYASDKALDVRIGNTTGAKVEINGAEQDIAPYNHGNVAHFKLFASAKSISRIEAQ